MGTIEIKLDASPTIHSGLDRSFLDIMTKNCYVAFASDFTTAIRAWKALGDGKGGLAVYLDGRRLGAKLVNAKRKAQRTLLPKEVLAASYSPTQALYGSAALAAHRAVRADEVARQLRVAVHKRAIDVLPLVIAICKREDVPFVMSATETDAQIPFHVKSKVRGGLCLAFSALAMSLLLSRSVAQGLGPLWIARAPACVLSHHAFLADSTI